MRTLSLAIALLLTLNVFSQKKAVTETGEEVILYPDGTWKTISGAENSDKPIPINPTSFTKNNEASFLVKSSKFNIGIWINPKKWSFKKAEKNEASEYEFELKDKDVYGLMIAESIEIPLETMKTIALKNGQESIPDLQIIKEEYRTVNGKKVLMLQMSGSLSGIKLTYYGYYYSNENGTLQLVTYTAQNLLKTHLADIESFLNGMVEL